MQCQHLSKYFLVAKQSYFPCLFHSAKPSNPDLGESQINKGT